MKRRCTQCGSKIRWWAHFMSSLSKELQSQFCSEMCYLDWDFEIHYSQTMWYLSEAYKNLKKSYPIK